MSCKQSTRLFGRRSIQDMSSPVTQRRMQQQSAVTMNHKQQTDDWLIKLKACRNLIFGRAIHAKIMAQRSDLDMYIISALLNMYRKCGSMLEARGVFDSLGKPNIVHWNTLLLGYVDNGESHVALELFSRMKAAGFFPNSVTYAAALKACTSLAVTGRAHCLKLGRQIHSEIGSHIRPFLQNSLVDMYSKCGSMVEARHVFDSIQEPNVVSWTALMLGYVANGEGQLALDLFSNMKDRGCQPDSVTYIAAFKACTSLVVNGNNNGKLDCLKVGRKIHSEVRCQVTRYMQTMLVDMYSKCGSMIDAQVVFDTIERPDLVHWTSLILGYAENGEGYVALHLFEKLKDTGFRPDPVTYVAALKACMPLAVNGARKKECLVRGRQIHSEIGGQMDSYLQSTLVDMYAKCGSMYDARAVFDTIREPRVVSWTALILGYAENGEGHHALDLFSRMKERGCVPNSITYIVVLKACTCLLLNGNSSGKLECLENGRKIHLEIGSNLNQSVQNTLVDMYCKCGSMQEARNVFDAIENPDVVSWTALLMGYAANGEGHVALDLLGRMKKSGCAPHAVTYIAAMKSCLLIGDLALGRKIHREISDFTPHLVTCLVDFYAKCGSMLESRDVFDVHPRSRDVSTWTALLAGYGRFGDYDTVFNIFQAMQDAGLHPDAVTFVSVLLCCSHAGLVEKATHYFEVMSVQYNLAPSVVHYTCMVDALGRGNQLNKAIGIMQKMPCNPNAVTWTTLLGACQKWKNIEIGKEVFRALADIDSRNATPFVLMADVYGSRGMLEIKEKILKRIMEFRAWQGQEQVDEIEHSPPKVNQKKINQINEYNSFAKLSLA